MQKNLNMIDRIVRLLLAIGVFTMIYMDALQGAWAWVLGIFSVILVGTSFISWCPIYYSLGLSTAPRTADEKGS
jgi:hypothetical protein